MPCKDYVPDPMAGGSDCAQCGWSQQDHDPPARRPRPTEGALFDWGIENDKRTNKGNT